MPATAATRMAVGCLLATVAVLLFVVARHHAAHRQALCDALAARGWTVRLLEGCGACRRQARALRGFRMYVLHAPGGAVLGGYTRTPPPVPGGLRGFPLWHNQCTGEARLGAQPEAALRAMAGLGPRPRI
jgi:hypothetical protein